MDDLDLSSVGDHFMIGLRPGATLHPDDRTLLSQLRPSGVILYKSNFLHDLPYEQWLPSHSKLVESIRQACGRDRLFIAIDHEGGRVCRTPPPITRYSYASRWAADAGKVGECMGAELASLGINLSFSPVLDVDSNPANPVIGERAFGRTPEDVIAAAIPFMRGMEGQGVRACGKHFPGHGDTKVDSHSELPVLDLSLEQIEQRELKPFKAAINAGIEMIMTSHIMFPAIDSSYPATLSRRLTHHLLRSVCGFQGVIISDDIGMHAMDGLLDEPDAMVRFIEAGNDTMMICSHWTSTERAPMFARALIKARETGRIPDDVLAASRQRVRTMLSKTLQHDVSALKEGDFAEHRQAGVLFSAATVEVI
jgi:beta-N-acetylhexosaminidase